MKIFSFLKDRTSISPFFHKRIAGVKRIIISYNIKNYCKRLIIKI
jgi:hypothetical protein